ncbi:NAD(P)/FAD-dependent oxidoreductase [Halioglobus maricola]|uniref:NAD(P)/FAD-dependent oxidoreductase n=1 Tax=Halioglobus maricola TaxID=2601894 RepID=A0A5P9NEY0_9GAMM|nr:FAD-dependent oxidoreductase [Halioglobus maricola]QFU74292.1 NAD(P)/FAD-dependent oxidoreductase [Halioglobus maricola]
MKQRLLIVGAGMATAYLLQQLDQQIHDYCITVVGDEEDVCYNRVLLSNLLAGENSEDDLHMLQAMERVQFIPGSRITDLGTTARIAFSENGESFPYDKLVLATGSSVARPDTDGTELKGSMVFRSLADARELHTLETCGKRAVVIGAGLLGLEAAHGLVKLGFETCVVHRNPVIMNRQLDSEGGSHLQQELEAKGIAFRLSSSLKEIRANDGRVSAIELDDGSVEVCDLLLFASGIVPNVQLARRGGIDADRGILVDAYLRTSKPGVFALGECCEFGQQGFGLVAPIRRQAEVLARYLCDTPTSGFAIEDYPTQLKISGVDIYRAGELDSDAEQIVLRDSASGLYRRLVVRDNRLVGAVLVGDKRGGTWYSELIREGCDISALRNSLIYGKEVAEAQLGAAA